MAMPCSRALAGLDRVTGRAVDQDLAGIDRVDPGEHLDHRRLAGAVVADEHQHRAGMGAERHVLKGDHVSESLGHVAQFE